MRKAGSAKARVGVGLMLLGALTMTGCDKIVDGSKAAQSVTAQAFDETTSSWRDFFAYHPPVPAPLPQTRYCYQMQSDIVCYDSVQPNLTAKLLGYQDGDALSWVQPGGGSLGVSGGPPIALRAPVASATREARAPIALSDEAISVQTVPFSNGQISSRDLSPNRASKKVN